MDQNLDLIIRNALAATAGDVQRCDIGVRAGRIAAIGEMSRSSAGETIDCRGLHVLPGVIDSHVHFREPGLTHKEDLETGSRAAVLGGVTVVFDMPNTDPATTTAEALADKVKRAHHRMHCDFAFYVGATRENTGQLGELEPTRIGHDESRSPRDGPLDQRAEDRVRLRRVGAGDEDDVAVALARGLAL